MTTTLLSRLYRMSVNATSSYISKVIVRSKFTGVSSKVRELRQLTSLPSHLNEAIIGMLLGDAGCYRTSTSPTSNSRLEFSFGAQRQQFARFIEELLKDFIQTSVTPLLVFAKPGCFGPCYAGGQNAKDHTSFRLKTVALPVFNYYRELFYKLNPDTGKFIKFVPINIVDLLSPIVLAHFVMGDGNYQPEARTIRIYTNGFTYEDVVLLSKAIESKYGITVGVRHDRKQQYILAIGAKNLDKFRELVRPHMHESMLYRIGL